MARHIAMHFRQASAHVLQQGMSPHFEHSAAQFLHAFIHRSLRKCTMKPALVGQLEELLEQAIADALESKKLKKLPVKSRPEITHLMAKAAVAVYEGVVEGRGG